MIIIIRTLKTRIVTCKKDSEESFKLNGASDGLNFEPGVNNIVKFAHLCLHEEETIEQVKEFLINCNNS